MNEWEMRRVHVEKSSVIVAYAVRRMCLYFLEKIKGIGTTAND